MQPHVYPQKSLLYITNFQPLLSAVVFWFLYSLEASCDKSYCDRSLLLHCSPKCTQCCYSTRAWSSCPPQWITGLTACNRISLNELWSCRMIVDLLLSALFLSAAPRRLLVLLLQCSSWTESPFQLSVFHFSCTQDLIIPLPCLPLLPTEMPLFSCHFLFMWKHTRFIT